jgi:arsenate reductase
MNLLPQLEPLADDLAGRPVAPERHRLLEQLADLIAARLNDGDTVPLTFICTHNSRRSHLAQVLATTAAVYYDVADIVCCSGGTEATACNERTVAAFVRAGFPVVDASGGDNPVYEIGYARDTAPIRAWSKIYHADGNPDTGYIAIMTCTHADEHCPCVLGATERFSLPFRDPKEADDTPDEAATYDARLREIGAEMFLLLRLVKERRSA